MITIYSKGLVSCSVCTDLVDIDQIELITNTKNPTGIESQWKISGDKTFKGGEPMPCPCNYRPKTHQHYLLVC